MKTKGNIYTYMILTFSHLFFIIIEANQVFFFRGEKEETKDQKSIKKKGNLKPIHDQLLNIPEYYCVFVMLITSPMYSTCEENRVVDCRSSSFCVFIFGGFFEDDKRDKVRKKEGRRNL